MINTSILKMLSQPKFWLCLPLGLGAVTRLWVTEVWSRDCISYQSSADGGLWVECFSECCFDLRLHIDVVIRQWHANIASVLGDRRLTRPSGRPFTSNCCQCCSECCSSRIRHLASAQHWDTCQQCQPSGKPGQCRGRCWQLRLSLPSHSAS